MSKPVIAVVVVAALAAGGYSAVWFQKAGEFKEKFITSVASLNTGAKTFLAPLPEGSADKPLSDQPAKAPALAPISDVISYESVEMSGFPFSMALTVRKPVFSLPIDTFLRMAPKDYPNGPKVPDGMTWVEEVAYGNDITLSSNLIGSKFTLSFSKDYTQKSVLNGKLEHTVISETATPMTCHLETDPSGFLVIHPVINSAEEFFSIFHSVECESKSSVSKDASGQMVASLNSMGFGVKANKNESTRQFSIKMNASDLVYGPGADPIMANYLRNIALVTGKPEQKIPYLLSEAGKSNMDFDMSYDGPHTEEGFKNKNLKLQMGINKLDVSSAFGNFSMQAVTNVEPLPNEKRKASLLFKVKSNVSERYDQILVENMKQTLQEVANTEGKSGMDLEIANNVAKLGPVDKLVTELLPRFHPFGDMIIDIETHSEGPANDTTFFTQGQHQIKSLNILTTPYGIKSNGEAKSENGAPAGNFSLTCINCDTMIDEVSNYIVRINHYIDALEPEKKTVHASKAFYDGIKALARAISLNGSDPQAKDLNFTLVAKNPSDITISGKPIMDVVPLYMSLVAPHLPIQPAPQIPNESMPPVMRIPQE